MTELAEVATDVFCVRGGLVNWYLLRDGQDLTLVDAGYPGDVAEVVASVERLGNRVEDVRAVLVTHAHADHVGSVAALHAVHGTPAFIGAADLEPARTGLLEQVTLPDVLAQAWRPSVARWAFAAVRRGGLRVEAAPFIQPLLIAAGDAVDLPGHPVVVPVPGHTPGHTAFHLPRAGVVITGDALVTGHPTARSEGPQTLPRMFDADVAGNREALVRLSALDADIVLPGHGAPLRTTIGDAVAHALSTPR